MPRTIGNGLSRREREILDLLHQLGPSSVSDVLEHLPEPPTYSAVRSVLRILEEKGHTQHQAEGKRYLYSPTQKRQTAAKTAIRQVIAIFFGGSLERAVKTFLSDKESDVPAEELARLSAMIQRAQELEEKKEER